MTIDLASISENTSRNNPLKWELDEYFNANSRE